MTIVDNVKLVTSAILALIFVLPSLLFGADLKLLEEKLLSRDRAGVHTELQSLYQEERDVFDKVVDFTNPVLDALEAFDKLKEYHVSNNSSSEKLLIDRFNNEWQKLPKKLPFSKFFVGAINNVSSDFKVIVREYNDRVKEAAKQKRLEEEKRRQAELDARQREEHERRLKEEEQRKQTELEQKIRLEKQEQARLHAEAIAKAHEEAVSDPKYKRQALVCQVCGAFQGKKDLKAGLKRYQTYETKFGVVNLSARQQAVNMDIEYDNQISQGKNEFRSLFKKQFPADVCNRFNSDECEEKLDTIEKRLIDEKLSKE